MTGPSCQITTAKSLPKLKYCFDDSLTRFFSYQIVSSYRFVRGLVDLFMLPLLHLLTWMFKWNNAYAVCLIVFFFLNDLNRFTKNDVQCNDLIANLIWGSVFNLLKVEKVPLSLVFLCVIKVIKPLMECHF